MNFLDKKKVTSRKLNLIHKSVESRNGNRNINEYYVQFFIILFFGSFSLFIKNDLVNHKMFVWTDSLTQAVTLLVFMFMYEYKDRDLYNLNRKNMHKDAPFLVPLLLLLSVVLVFAVNLFIKNKVSYFHFHGMSIDNIYHNFFYFIVSNIPLLLLMSIDLICYIIFPCLFTFTFYSILLKFIPNN